MAEDNVLRWREDAPVTAEAVALADLLAGSNASVVRLEPADDARALAPHLGQLARIDIAFPKFRDGRGFSSARLLREAGFGGEIRAVGDVKVDQLAFLRRVGFDAVAPLQPFDPAVVARTLSRFPFAYMKAADAVQPVWALRAARA